MSKSNRTQQGFSLIELMVVVAILTVVMGVVFEQIDRVQQTHRKEDTTLDMTQQSRELMDLIVRDLAQAGYPPQRMFGPGALIAPPDNDSRAAVGLVAYSPSTLWFEGDVDGDGTVDSVRYTLFDSAGAPAGGGSRCPCSLRRSQQVKIMGTPPMNQPVNYGIAVQRVISSGGMVGGGPLPLLGNTNMGNGILANDVVYVNYRNPQLFQAFDALGNPVAPTDIATNPALLRTITNVRITVSVMAQPISDMQTGVAPAMTMTAMGQVLN
jgi:prepilin-type N-terminal cleavage/methylation domain-containing protein